MKALKLISILLVVSLSTLTTPTVFAGCYIKRKNIYIGKRDNTPLIKLSILRSSEIKRLKENISFLDAFISVNNNNYNNQLEKYKRLKSELADIEEDLKFKSNFIKTSRERRNVLRERLKQLKPIIGRCN